MKAKKNYRIITAALLAFAMFACSNIGDSQDKAAPANGKASISINLGDGARTIMPSFQYSDLTSIILSGAFGSGVSKDIRIWDSYADLCDAIKGKVEDLEVGTWSFSIECKIEDEVVFAGTLDKTLVAGNNTLAFDLENVDGSGKIKVTLSLDCNASAVQVVTAQLLDENGNDIQDFDEQDLALDNGEATYGESVQKGVYIVRFKLYSDTAKTSPITTATELVSVAAGLVSKGTIKVKTLNPSHMITYNLNGGNWASGVTAPLSFTEYDEVVLPTRESLLQTTPRGVLFTGWYTTETFDEGTEISCWNPEEVTDDIILYARYSKFYNIAYSSNGGTWVTDYIAPSRFTEYDEVVLPTKDNITKEITTTPSRNPPYTTYYSLDGWYTTSTFDENTKIEKIEKGTTSGIYVYAKWVYYEYQITYNLNGGEGINNPISYNQLDNVNLGVATKENYIFAGWYEANDFSGKALSSWNAREREGDLTLYAKWTTLESLVSELNGSGTSILNAIPYLPANTKETPYKISLKGKSSNEELRDILAAIKVNSECYFELEMSDENEITSFLYSEKTSSISYKTYSMFDNVTNLTKVVLPNTIDTLSDYDRDFMLGNSKGIFKGCTSLKEITIPSSVTSIGENAFSGCTSLENINVTDDNPNYCSVDGAVLSKDQTRLVIIPPGRTSYEMPDTITSYSADTINAATSLEELTVSSGIKIIDSYENDFSNNKSLKKIILKGVVCIDYGAFKDCTALEEVVLPDSLQIIGNGIFEGCISLKKINIPANTKMEDIIFPGCISLTDIEVDENNKWYAAENGCILSKDKTILLRLPSGKTDVIPSTVTTIGYRCFSEVQISEISLPNTITKIERCAFLDSSVVTVNIPSSVTVIDNGFDGWAEFLTNINVESGNANYSSIDGVLFNKEKTSLIVYPEGRQGDYTIPNSVTSIGGSAFYRCKNLTGITIPDSVTSIEGGAFYECSGLISVEIPNSVTLIGSSVFYDCKSLSSITILGSGASIGNSAFYNCTSLTSVTLGSVASIGAEAFYSCSSLASITIPDSVTSIGTRAFRYCSSLASITIPDSVTSIGEEAFYSCSSLTSVTLDSVTSIGTGAFGSCSSLTSITIPDSVTTIEKSAFAYCSKLTSVTFSNPNNWRYTSSSSATSGTDISSADLQNTSTAATYLVSTYKNYYWRRTP